MRGVIQNYGYSLGTLLNGLIFLLMGILHPLYSYLMDAFTALNGIRMTLGLILLYFAVRMIGTGEGSMHRSHSRRPFLLLLLTLAWIDIVTSIDTMILVSHASPSVGVTVVGNLIGTGMLIAFAPILYRWLESAPWLQLWVAGYMAYTATIQLRHEPLLQPFQFHPLMFHLLGLLMIVIIGLYGWSRMYRSSMK
jgi:predicted tellurium resistance membrane protein TerC